MTRNLVAELTILINYDLSIQWDLLAIQKWTSYNIVQIDFRFSFKYSSVNLPDSQLYTHVELEIVKSVQYKYAVKIKCFFLYNTARIQ